MESERGATRLCLCLSVALTMLSFSCNTGTSASNRFISVSTDRVAFDSRNEVDRAELTVTANTAGVVVSAREATDPGPDLTDSVSATETSPTAVQVTVTRRDPSELDPGLHEGSVRIRACVGEDCVDELIDVTYFVVALELDRESHTFRQRVGDPNPSPFEVNLSHSDGSDSSWTATVVSVQPTDWISVTPSGASFVNTAAISVDGESEPGRFSAFVRFESDAGTTSLSVSLEVLNALEVDTNELSFTASAGVEPASRTVTLSDAGLNSYPWQVYFRATNPGMASCPQSIWLRLIPGSGLTLPASVELQPDTLLEAASCSGEVEIVADGVTHHVLPVDYTVTE